MLRADTRIGEVDAGVAIRPNRHDGHVVDAELLQFGVGASYSLEVVDRYQNSAIRASGHGQTTVTPPSHRAR